jgi:hypothetical protein
MPLSKAIFQPFPVLTRVRDLQRAIDNATTSRTRMFPSGCLDTRYGPWGVGDAVFVGPPAVSSPAAGDRWRAGQVYTVIWNPAGSGGSWVSLTLWQGGTCLSTGGIRVAILSSQTPDDGRFQYTVPAGLPPRNDYVVQVQKLDCAANCGLIAVIVKMLDGPVVLVA